MKRALFLAAGLMALPTTAAPPCPADIPRIAHQLVATHPHNPDAFTQGLAFAGGQLVESSGGYGRSFLALGPPGGAYTRQTTLPKKLFAEGLAVVDDHIWLLSWKRGVARVYEMSTLALLAEHRYRGEGWGLTSDGKTLYMSDGSAGLTLRRPDDFSEISRRTVRAGERALSRLNELEWVDGQIFANIWGSDHIARIDPDTGCVNGWLDLSALWPRAQRPATADVLNGIAWQDGHLWVTGKRWPTLYQLRLQP